MEDYIHRKLIKRDQQLGTEMDFLFTKQRHSCCSFRSCIHTFSSYLRIISLSQCLTFFSSFKVIYNCGQIFVQLLSQDWHKYILLLGPHSDQSPFSTCTRQEKSVEWEPWETREWRMEWLRDNFLDFPILEQ